ncbi:MAG: single-stranded-DNA-specific exonuclease RecJ, partial [Patescibacteria group bacterium]|nr:single-stranded-DNA-specific exonuclease RecJ [Patescibacteria group bacterium]
VAMTHYRIRDPIPESADAALAEYSPLVRALLFRRGISEAEDARKFLAPDYTRDTHDPFLMKDMERAVDRILEAIERGERIVVYNDYDCDGIPGGVILHDFFQKIGHNNFTNYVPHRYSEGYGLNSEAIEQFRVEGVSLVITVDCGITDVAEVTQAQGSGIDVIITDHHLPLVDQLSGEQVIPAAYAVINNKQRDDGYPFKELCGAGTAFKLVQAVLMRLRMGASGGEGMSRLGCSARHERETERGVLEATASEYRSRERSNAPNLDIPKEGWEKWLLDMAGLATIADMVPLHGENRTLVHFGLTVLRKSPRPGFQQLLRRARVAQRSLTEDDVGFMVAPRINAASRMGEPMEALRLLATRDVLEGGVLAEELHALNERRKGLVAGMVREARARFEEYLREREARLLVVLGSPSWMPGLLGLAANSLVEEYQRPVFLWGRAGSETIKGSCRSDGSVNVVELMSAVRADVFLDFGGHERSGGFSISHEYIHTLEAALEEAHGKILGGEGLAPVSAGAAGMIHKVDAELSLADLSWETYREIAALAPFGIGNPKPLFVLRDLTITRVRTFGRDGGHLEIRFSDVGKYPMSITSSRTTISPVPAVGFFMKPDGFSVALEQGARMNLLAHLEASYFRTTPELRLRIVDIF